jgi:hypothetical protein
MNKEKDAGNAEENIGYPGGQQWLQVSGVAKTENELKNEQIDERQGNTYGNSHRYSTVFTLVKSNTNAQERHNE